MASFFHLSDNNLLLFIFPPIFLSFSYRFDWRSRPIVPSAPAEATLTWRFAAS
jgi:hypothetical protein